MKIFPDRLYTMFSRRKRRWEWRFKGVFALESRGVLWNCCQVYDGELARISENRVVSRDSETSGVFSCKYNDKNN